MLVTYIDESSELTEEQVKFLLEDFKLTFAPEMKPKKVNKGGKTKLSNTTNKNPKRCTDTIDFIEVEFGDKYQKCKGCGY